jgi:hypothetical protein
VWRRRVAPDGRGSACADDESHPALRAVIAARLRARRDPRGTVRGQHLVELATGRAASPAESRLLWRVVDAGFPIPEVDWPVTDLDGRELHRLDLARPTHRIVVEYQGCAAHVDRTAADRARAEDLRRRGRIVRARLAPGGRDPVSAGPGSRQASATRRQRAPARGGDGQRVPPQGRLRRAVT